MHLWPGFGAGLFLSMRDRILELRRVRAGDLQPHAMNARQHPEEQRRVVEGSLATLGQVAPVLAYLEGDRLRLFDGHLRREIDPEAEITVAVTDLTPAEARQALATLDRSSALAETDDALLSELLSSIRVDTEAGLLVEDERLEGLLKEIITPPLLTDPDELPAAGTVPARSVRGEVWTCGSHRVMCGDATSAQDVARLMDGEKSGLMVTDPPWGVEYDANWRNEAAAKGQISHAASRVGKVMNDDCGDWRSAWELFGGEVVYCWHAGLRASEAWQSLEAVGFEIRAQIIWAKPMPVISRGHYHFQHEPCFYAVRKGATASWTGDRSQTTLWPVNLDANVEGGHSTQKPVECMARAIRNHEGDVYDPFLGSGTTLIAAEQLGRRAFGMEIEPRYVDIALARWEKATGRAAERVE